MGRRMLLLSQGLPGLLGVDRVRIVNRESNVTKFRPCTGVDLLRRCVVSGSRGLVAVLT